MSVLIYWKERLAAKAPIYTEGLKTPVLNLRANLVDPQSSWPHAVARSALFDDYTAWHEDVYVTPYRASAYYAENPKRVPRSVDQLQFFSTIAPWVYIVGKKQQVRTYLVPHRYQYEGEWVDGKINRYFIRLCSWKEHVAAFELNTGLPVTGFTVHYDPDRASVVAHAVKSYNDRIDDNREKMAATMGSR